MLKVNTCYGRIDAEFMTRLSSVKLMAFDVDGTITDGGIIYDSTDLELKRFNTKDGFGIAALVKEGIECAVITGRTAHLTQRRMNDLHVQHVIQGEKSKNVALTELCEKLNISLDEAVCIGDDLNDMPMFRVAGLSVCPHDAHPFIKKQADYITTCNAGYGAVRELCDLILISKGILNPDGGFADERY
ncbi:MAG: HAD-IIIA family hydrolase [Succinivibrio sp.]|mgnify:CR=1 FL=1|jgi:3-deoxy-D-manno-octulosonate 8-phosphate phosphatase (KDO 8-P phosphatase)|uniref:3-deoxy-D-manno-octulosonate 8-phosphate phosphatase KdsC n=1 Tax=Succinivibrio dextrinosolvens DSM 3072 TaxID=1123324 RepID=A0A1T4V309_9GAMM|nr:HAD-IIIA family hydrolase [Succinivibrio dextrinosolvens]MBE6423552.1 HAD-IIIA family hydrolase [Succinivibrio dextrinosolvens]MBP5244779.1 HAD-IIIA family hydrolase [Succinivibrio sp.]MBQ3677994.1 HAD-IIIA family hydrolase [Succinivibrio sp.]SKA59353.1 3-deoxy-D-manno-octulosonate 8-phosphate phosphatase (KDO 8-P phosphatase) [Succinivibrio dextrinosolvens DSM 3072]